MSDDTASTPRHAPPNPLPATARLSLLAVLLWCSIPLSPQSVDSDFWGHVQYGRDVLRYGLDRTATYTYNAVGYPWINHENIAELIFAWAADGPGVSSLLVLKCLLGVSLLFLAAGMARAQGVGTSAIAATQIVVALNLSYYWGLRPHLFSFVFFGVMIAGIEWCFADWPGRWRIVGTRWLSTPVDGVPTTGGLVALGLMPVLFVVWTNTHGGFLAGIGVFSVLLGCRIVEFAWPGANVPRRVPLLLAAWIVLGLLATLVNPYGLELHRWLRMDLGVPRPEIREWSAPPLFGGGAGNLWLLYGLLAASLAGTRRPRDLAKLLVLGIVAQQALQHQRHTPFLALLVAFWIPPHLHSTGQRFFAMASARTPVVPRRWQQAVIALLACTCGLLAYRLGERFAGVPVQRNDYPVAAMQYLADQNLTGRLVVDGHWAQYVLGVMGARRPDDAGIQVAFDGRFRTCYPQLIADLHFDFFLGDGDADKRYRSPQSPPVNPGRILDFNQPDLVLLSRRQTHALRVLKAVEDEWTLLYQDQLAQLWGRREVFDEPAHPKYLAAERRQITNAPQVGAVNWPGAPLSWNSRPIAQARPTSPVESR